MEVSNTYNQYGLVGMMRQMHENTEQSQLPPSLPSSHHQPLPISPPQQQNGDAAALAIAHHFSYDSFPMPFSVKSEPEDIIDGQTIDEKKFMSPVSSHQPPDVGPPYHDLSNDIKQRLYQSGFTPYSRDDPILKPFKCPICGKAFGRLSHVRRHQLLHTGEKPFECEICHEKFTRVENRTRHMSIHTGERRHNCHLCGKGFSQLNRLNVHIRIHSGERPFVCEICGKAFGRIDHKNCHMRTHNWIRDKTREDKKPLLNNDLTLISEQSYNQNSTVGSSQPPEHLNNYTDGDIHKPFKCPECGKQFARKDHLNRHIFIHSGTKPYKCEICSKRFSRKDNKYKHMASCIYMHFGIIIVKRPPSGSEIYSLEDTKSLESKINDKLRELQDGKLLPPPSPPMSPKANLMHALELNAVPINDSSQYNTKDEPHYLEDDEPQQYQTNDGMKLPQSKDGSVEILLVRPDLHHPDSDMDDSNVMNEEEIQEMGEVEIKTEMEYPPSSNEGMSNNYPVGELHGMPTRSYQCKHCDKAFMHKSHLVRHALVHTGDKPFKCDQCEKCFYRKEHLQRHVVSHTGIKPYKCNFCDKSFMQISQQMKHILQHVNGETQFLKVNDEERVPGGQDLKAVPRIYQCDRCDKVYARKSHLKRHYTLHTGEKPYNCEVCGQGFSRLEHRKRHMTIHTRLKKYACEFCDKKFARPDHMLVHIKRHRDVLPYKCNQCGCRFNTSKEKVDHLRTHTGAYRCEICAERFELYVDLAEHRERVHQLEQPKQCIKKLQGSLKSEIIVSRKEQFPCPICYQRFDILSLSEHMKTHIQDMELDESNEYYNNDDDDEDDEEPEDDNEYDEDDMPNGPGDEDDQVKHDPDLNIVDMCAVKIELESTDEECDMNGEMMAEGVGQLYEDEIAEDQLTECGFKSGVVK